MGSRKKKKVVIRHKVLFIQVYKQLSIADKIALKASLFHYNFSMKIADVVKDNETMRRLLFELCKPSAGFDYSWLHIRGYRK